MIDTSATIPVLILTGPVGVGKTTVAGEISNLLDDLEISHAVIDMDWLRWCYPSPERDPFHTALGLQNLAAVWANYRAAGAGRLILVDIVEARSEIASYYEAIPGAKILVVRLHALIPTILQRLEGRESGASLAWHQRRAVELVEQWEKQPVEDLLVDTDGKTPIEVARDVRAKAGWTKS